ncbi:MAG: hypothetical protein IM624_03395 [Phenylobacterium sp.]|uniref:hypothetical protein n=1 Tax=Phenylobacterium sp. TaxID=1871053 RepID=UPI0025EEA387|nr:hypothetical protein [Phenylobacterium sp.]MCA6298228.1 hypothetical protein [Phenylobacterium sp.]
MSETIEHFIYGAPARLKRFRTTLPAGVSVRSTQGGLILRETLDAGFDIDSAIARIEALAVLRGVEYDGWGRMVEAADPQGGIDLQSQTFTVRTGVRAGHGFALPLPDGRFGHAIHLGGDKQGYLLVEVSALVTDQPASPDDLQRAPRWYRQPILIWHTGFAALPLAADVKLAGLPLEIAFRDSIGWPDPDAVAQLERRFKVARTDTPEGWRALLGAMDRSGERLPGIDGFCLVAARVGRTGALKLIWDHDPVEAADRAQRPMPWQPSHMDDVISALLGAPDFIKMTDTVT